MWCDYPEYYEAEVYENTRNIYKFEKSMGNKLSDPQDVYDIARHDDLEEFEEQIMNTISWADSMSSGCSSTGRAALPMHDRNSLYYDRFKQNQEVSNQKYLNLAYEELQKIPVSIIDDAILNNVQILDLSNNFLKDVSHLSDFERLRTLVLDRNIIDDTTVFPKMPRLKALWLNYNRIQNVFPFISSLSVQCPNLEELCLMGNLICPNYLNGGTESQNEVYRLMIIKHFPKLTFLDDSSVTPEERQKCGYRRLSRTSFSGPSTDSIEQTKSFVSIDEGIEMDSKSAVY